MEHRKFTIGIETLYWNYDTKFLLATSLFRSFLCRIMNQHTIPLAKSNYYQMLQKTHFNTILNIILIIKFDKYDLAGFETFIYLFQTRPTLPYHLLFGFLKRLLFLVSTALYLPNFFLYIFLLHNIPYICFRLFKGRGSSCF